MNRPHSLRLLRGLFALSVMLHLDAAQARAAPAPPAIKRQLLDKRAVEGAPGLETQLWLIEYPPGAAAPVHHHPVVGIGYVMEGEFESAFGQEPPVRVKAGQSFVDPARVEHRLFRNASTERPLKFLVAYTIPAGRAPVEMSAAPRVELRPSGALVTIAQAGLYPETVEVNPRTGKFLVGSVREGTVYEIGLDGAARPLVKDDRLTSILGIVVDPNSNRLLVTNSDLGVGSRRSAKGGRREAGVGIYDLTSGRPLRYVDLTSLHPDGDHLINGITVDGDGNAYVTDSFSPVIYKIDAAGVATVFLTDDAFKGAGINLNGIVYHPRGFLLAVKKNSGALYRIPLEDPRHFARVDVPASFVGGDGLLLVGGESLVLIANQTPAAASNAAFVLRSRDNWATATVVASRSLGAVYPTTCATLAGKLFLLSSHLDELIGATDATSATILRRARRGELQEIGIISE